VRLLLEGADPAAVDKAMRAFGMPVGPFELLDDVGIDVATKGAETLSGAWPDRMAIDPAFEKMVSAKRLGRKSGKGFYSYEREKRTGLDPALFAELGLSSPSKKPSSSEIEQRLLYPMVNEAAFCLAEEVVESPAKLDLAMIFGTGFPPFRGGLCAWADAVGAAVIVDGLSKLASDKGPRFAPAPLLSDLARTGRKFFNV
jgi:3-hydroxyacyl-CoA dehydrogenase/enoyl-CoA hydratase/3-hydroxybutyryl-CoA epimerase